MSKRDFLNNVGDNLEKIINIFIGYFGNAHESKIIGDIKKIEFMVLENGERFLVCNEEYIMGEEPVCVKRSGKTYLVLPSSLLADAIINVLFIHLLIHSIVGEVFSEKIQEILIDYMAQNISEELGRQKINISENENPVYVSNSMYSSHFPSIENYFESNKNEIINSMINGVLLSEEQKKRIEKMCDESDRHKGNKFIVKK